MKQLHLLIQKFLICTFALTFVFSVVYVPHHYNQIQKAEALACSNCVNEFPTGIFTKIQTTLSAAYNKISSFATNQLANKEFLLDGLAWFIAKQIVSQITGSIVNWINSGFQGSPAFIQDLDDFLLETADFAFGAYLEDVAPALCAPFRLDIQIALEINYQSDREVMPRTCSLTGVMENLEDFVDGDFIGGGGWETWMRVVSNPETYTAFGAYLEAETIADIRINNARVGEVEKLGWGEGFLSQKTCTPVEGQAEPKCDIITPGTVIVDSLEENLGNETKSLIEADEIDEILGSLFAQLSQRAIAGAGGLLGLTGGSGGGGGGGGNTDNPYSQRRDEQFIQTMREARALESSYISLATNYQPQLQAIANNFLLSEQQRIVALEESLLIPDIISRANANIISLDDLIGRYEVLMSSAGDSNSAKLDIMSEFSSLGTLHSQADLVGSETTWKSYTTIIPVP